MTNRRQGRASRYEESRPSQQTTASGGEFSAAPPVPRKWRAAVKWIVITIVTLALVPFALHVAKDKYDEYFVRVTKLSGSILYSSWGYAFTRAGPVPAVLMYVSESNAREVPVVPVSYHLEAKVDGVWHSLSAYHPPTDELKKRDQLRIRFEDGASVGHPGPQDAVFPPEDYLMHESNYMGPIVKGGSKNGLLWFIAHIPLDNFRRRTGMRLTIVDTVQREHVIEEDKGKYVDPAAIERLTPKVRWVSPGAE